MEICFPKWVSMENPFSFLERRLNRLEDLLVKVDERLELAQEKELAEKLLSPIEACKLFYPPISKSTLNRWEKQGLVKKYTIGGRTFFKYSEILSAATSLEKFKH